MNPKVDQYIVDGCMRCPLGATPQCKVNYWQPELEMLRQILLESELKEELKWGVPCYTLNGKNVLLLSALKKSCNISFLKGSLIDDINGMLKAPGPNSQAARYLEFTELDQIKSKKDVIKNYIQEAIKIERSGKKIQFAKNPEPVPEELESKFEEDPVFKSAFESLTPGRQRGYILHFSQPKQSSTRSSRIEKCTSKILNGEGLNDYYKKGK